MAKRTNRRIRGVPQETQDDLNEVIAQLSARLAVLEKKPVEQPTQRADFTAREKQVITVEAPSGGINGTLVQSTQFNKGERITFIQKNSNPVTYRAISGTINGQRFVISNAAGTYEAISDGEGGWAIAQGITAAGVPGAPGTPGLPGSGGAPGMPGRAGGDGRQGFPGMPGAAGAAGATGAAGAAGVPGVGIPGRMGSDGRMGIPGPKGDTGAAGPPGVAGAIMSTQTISLGSTPALSGSFQLVGLVGLAVGIPVPISLAVIAADPTESEEQIVITGISTSSTTVDCYWQSVDGTPKAGSRLVQFLVADSVSVVGPWLEVIETGAGPFINYALDPLANSLAFSPAAPARQLLHSIVGGFEGRRLFLRPGSGVTELAVKHEGSGTTANRIRTPNEEDYVLYRRDTAELLYSASRWNVIGIVRQYRNSVSLTWAATQNDVSTDGVDHFRLQLTGDQTVTGFAPAAASTDNDGQTIVVYNRDDVDTLTIAHLDSGSISNNQVACPNNAAVTVAPRSSATLRYDGTSLAWRVISVSATTAVLSRHTRTGTGAFGVTQLPGTTWFRLQGQAGGGGGGGARVALTRECAAGGGGGPGGYFDIWIPATAVAGSAVTGSVGNGGNGGLAGSSGGNTTLTYDGVTYTAFGGGVGADAVSGTGATANSAGQLVNMADGGTAGATDQTDFQIQCGNGYSSLMFSGAALINCLVKGGDGGASFFGDGQKGGKVVGVDGTAAGSSLGAPGSGGAGGARLKNVAGAALDQGGNNGEVGIAIITQYSGTPPFTVQF